jgi:putative FmdB family regulatory protein
MPLFEYQCSECGAVTEFLESASAKGPHACSKCGSKKTARKLSTFAAQMGSSSAPSCADGSCSGPSACPTGSCPFA